MAGCRHAPIEYNRIILAVASAALMLSLVACSGDPPQMTPTSAPGFALSQVGGGIVSLSDYRGKVVLLDFWATTCPPCRAAMSHLDTMQEELGGEGLVVLGLNMDKNREDVEQYLASHPVGYPVLFVDASTRAAYGGVTMVPETFLVDRAGQVRRKFVGYDHRIATQIEQQVQKLLKEQ